MGRQGRTSRNYYEIENARNLTPNELAALFVPTAHFWRVLSFKNNVILGSRGSGKTAIAKMLSHDHLSKSKNSDAKKIIASGELIGIYLPTKLEWAGGLQNTYAEEKDASQHFQWKLNIASCAAFLTTLQSCLNSYIKDPGRRQLIEQSIIQEIVGSWNEGRDYPSTIKQAQMMLADIEHAKHQQNVRKRITGEVSSPYVGVYFDSDLFAPLRHAIDLVTRHIKRLESSKWILAIDEAELLNENHHRILNTHLRADPGRLVFKIATMPYHHYTLETSNPSTPLTHGDDFEYVYIDNHPTRSGQREDEFDREFAEKMFSNLANKSRGKYKGITLDKVFGPSLLLDPKPSAWTKNSDEYSYLSKHATQETLNRANALLETNPDEFKNQISRKMHGALLLKEAISVARGQRYPEIYSGASLVVRCGDGNPRRLIRLFNSLLNAASRDIGEGKKSGIAGIPKRTQTRVLIEFSSNVLGRLKAEPRFGDGLYNLLLDIGNYMKNLFHEEKISTDLISSVKFDAGEEEWQLVKTAVGLGLLYPNISTNRPDQMPIKEGTFRLAYVLAPNFRLLPRRGKSRSLSSILRGDLHQYKLPQEADVTQGTLFNDEEKQSAISIKSADVDDMEKGEALKVEIIKTRH